MADLLSRPLSKRPRDTESDIIPVILKVIDDEPNFKQMVIAAREAFSKAIVASHGERRDSLVLLGGDIKITPSVKPNNPST
ncbi:hypothetical protein DAPPUDRAFT_242570 [Daphnia pulex]|uniref:Uncharacterized protein n=1 Tax=Daphnia pulex TaxID=6669 RepID=E9GGZ5_DAPPU|nr:hypothetical protein DAPPUDRAFT_242570 [Daphnia pulex]|eukprot:EFX81113.1 hypothetical protein DAPPUDRAFT_242570 [Daphnia pulex]